MFRTPVAQADSIFKVYCFPWSFRLREKNVPGRQIRQLAELKRKNADPVIREHSIIPSTRNDHEPVGDRFEIIKPRLNQYTPIGISQSFQRIKGYQEQLVWQSFNRIVAHVQQYFSFPIDQTRFSL